MTANQGWFPASVVDAMVGHLGEPTVTTPGGWVKLADNWYARKWLWNDTDPNVVYTLTLDSYESGRCELYAAGRAGVRVTWPQPPTEDDVRRALELAGLLPAPGQPARAGPS